MGIVVLVAHQFIEVNPPQLKFPPFHVGILKSRHYGVSSRDEGVDLEIFVVLID